MTSHTIATKIAAAIATLTVGAVLAGCSSGSTAGPAATAAPAASSSASPSQAHNQADITFLQAMIPHHTQAVEMSKLAAQRASSPQVKDLAAGIEAAQQPEIDQMNAMLQAWNASTSATNGPSMSGMNHGNMGGTAQAAHGPMTGMMSDQQMQQLNTVSGPAFDRMFLQMMIQHHQGAVTMAKTELTDGQNPEAKALAQTIIDAQQREITEMQTLLG
jgi:uncharacterized protein (DUF305 family)